MGSRWDCNITPIYVHLHRGRFVLTPRTDDLVSVAARKCQSMTAFKQLVSASSPYRKALARRMKATDSTKEDTLRSMWSSVQYRKKKIVTPRQIKKTPVQHI